MDIAAIRSQIPATKRTIYFNTGWSGPSPRPVLDAITHYLEFENTEGPASRPAVQKHGEIRRELRGAFAQLMGASPEEIVLTDNTTRGINIVVNGLPWERGDEVLTDDLEHGSALVPSYYLRQRREVSVKIVQLNAQDDEKTILEKLERAISPRTRLLLLSHIMYSVGLLLPLAAVQRLAHRHGARVLVDGAQSLGQIPLDMRALACDYYAVPAHKWVLGPEGVGALFVRRELLSDLIPTEVAGRAAASYDQAGNFQPALAVPEKFELTTSSGALHAGTLAAIRFLQEVGVAEIQARWQGLAERLRRGLSGVSGVTVTSPAAGPTASGLVTFAARGWEPQRLTEALMARENIVARAVNYPLGAVRISVDFFNTEEEIDCVVETVRTLVNETTAR